MKAKKGILTMLFVLAAILAASSAAVNGQTLCPVDKPNCVILSQETAAKLLDTVNQLIAAKDTIAALMKERGASDVAIAQAQKVIAGYADLEVINGRIIAGYKEIMDLQAKTIELYAGLVEKMTAQLNKPKSTWAKIVDGLKAVGYILAGVSLGRAL